MAAAQSIASAIDLDAVLERGLKIIAEHAGAERGALALMHEDDLYIDAIYGPAGDDIQTLDAALPLVMDGVMPAFSPEIVHHVARTREPLALDDVRRDSRFRDTAYVHARSPRSILCVPLLDHHALLGVVYLENNAQTVAFPPHRVDIVQLLGAQAAVAITNARLVTERMEQTRLRLLQTKNADLEREAWELARLNVDKDKFFSIISHDLRNPFNMMLNLVEIAVDEVEEATPEEMKDMLLKLQQAAESCYTLLENLLTWSRLQSGRMAYNAVVADLHGMAEGTVLLLQGVAQEKGITLRNAVEQGMRIHADRFMIDMVIRNLISNALKFTPRGGEVVVSARMYGAEVEEVEAMETVPVEVSDEVSEEMAPEVEDDGAGPEMVEVAVRDTGIGIRQEDIDKLFRSDVHHTTKGTANEQGTGLGLAMCVEMVKQNGGEIRVESEVGVGTTFLFTVPVFVESPEDDKE
jgi:signal transduction histidine kinase